MASSTERNHPHDYRCTECATLLGLFLGRRHSRDSDRRFRELLEGCSECRRDYEEAVHQTASLAKSLKETRTRRILEGDKQKRRRERVTNAQTAYSRTKRTKRFYLQLMVVPALLMWAMIQLNKMGEAPAPVVAKIVWERGEVNSGGTMLSADITVRDLVAGDVISLEAGARAKIVLGESEIPLEGANQWLATIEPGRFRVLNGGATVRAADELDFVTADGIATVHQGSLARITVARGRTELQALEGELDWLSAHGDLSLGAGESWPR